MQVTIEWKIRAEGRKEGGRETVELTDYVQALINQGRVVVVEYHFPKPVVAVVEAPLDAPAADPVPTPEEVMAKTLTEPAPKPRPRPVRK